MKKRTVVAISSMLLMTGFVTACAASPAGNAAGGNATNTNSAATSNSISGTAPASSFHEDKNLTASWLDVNSKQHSVSIHVTAPVNNLSLNGYSHGFANVVVPVGWHVTVNFDNKNQVISEGLVVVKHADLSKGTQATPAIKGASTPGYQQGTAPSHSTSFKFVPRQAGQYILESAQTGQSGTWIWFTVSSAKNIPAVETR